MNENDDWLYAKIYFRPGKRTLEATLLGHVRPLVDRLLQDGLIRGHFYILYAERGYHIRLRLRGNRIDLRRRVRPLLFASAAAAIANVRQIAAEMPAGSEWRPTKWTRFAWLFRRGFRPAERLELGHYEPELEKYGGTHGMAISEAHFQDSSEAAFRILEAAQSGTVRRQQAVLLLAERLFRAFGSLEMERHEFFLRCRDHWIVQRPPDEGAAWLSYFDERCARAGSALARQLPLLDAPPAGALGETLFRWGERADETARALTTLERERRLATKRSVILQNYLHMLCNRLAIGPMEEAFLLHLLAGAETSTAGTRYAAAS